MKFRKDFVTNSSSSSYICEICGATQSGWDLSLDDCGMFECENGHVLCQEHMIPMSREEQINVILKNKYWNEETDEYDYVYSREELESMDDDDLFRTMIYDEYYEVPECLCPICQFHEYSEVDTAMYLRSEYKVPKSEVFKHIKAKNKRRRKLYDYEYIAYVVNKYGLDLSGIQSSWKEKFKSYKDFKESLPREYLRESLNE